MRVLFTAFASSSHFTLMVPLAWAIRAAGHEVCVAAQPDLEQVIQDAGLTAVAVGDELDLANAMRGSSGGGGFDIAETRAEKLTWDYVRGTLALYSGIVGELLADQKVLDDLVDFARSWKPDLVIWDALTYTGPVAARVVGAAQARLVFGMDHLARMRDVFHTLASRQPVEFRDDPMGHWLASRLAPYGAEFDDKLVTGQLSIDPMPPWLQFETSAEYLPMRFVPYGGRGSYPEWVLGEPEQPRIGLTLGLAARSFGFPEPCAERLIAAVAELDVDIVATLSIDQLSPSFEVPDNVRLVDFVALEILLPTCAVIVHHLGTGSTLAAIRYGVPQLCVSDETSLWGEDPVAQRLVERGAALTVTAGELSPELLRASVARLLEDPAFRRGAAIIRDEMLATASPASIVGTLEELVERNVRSE